MIKSRRRFHFLLSKPWRLRRRISIKGRAFNVPAARPESRADYFMRIRLAGNRIGSGTLRSAPPRKARHAQVKAPPEEMYRTFLADEACPKFLKDRVAQNQNFPHAMCILSIVRSMLRIALEAHRVRHFARHRPEFHFNAQ